MTVHYELPTASDFQALAGEHHPAVTIYASTAPIVSERERAETAVKSAFDGFANDIVIIIASALVLSAAVARSGLVDTLLAPLVPRLKSERSQVPVFSAATAVLSMVSKNVGALALMMPTALQIAKRTDVPASRVLMPMSFASLVGGLAVLVGTSPNIIVSEVRGEATGTPFGMFDYFPAGGILTVIAVVYLTFAYRLLPSRPRWLPKRPMPPPNRRFRLSRSRSTLPSPPRSRRLGRSTSPSCLWRWRSSWSRRDAPVTCPRSWTGSWSSRRRSGAWPSPRCAARCR